MECCNDCQHQDRKHAYYGKDGKVVDKTQYSIECEKHSCEKIGDDYYSKKAFETHFRIVTLPQRSQRAQRFLN